MDNIGSCKKCGRYKISTKHTSAGNFIIQCRLCGNTVMSGKSPEEAIKDWNTWEDTLNLPPDPNIPVSPDGKFQIYRIKVKHEGSYKIKYCVPRFVGSHVEVNDSIHDDLAEAIKKAEIYRKEYEEREQRKIEEERLRVKRIEEQKKREDLHGFTDSMLPVQRGRTLQHMQKRGDFVVSEKERVMTLKDFIQCVYLEGNAVTRIREQKYGLRGKSLAKPITTYYVNDQDVGRTAYEYLEYLKKNKIKIEA